MSLSHGEIYRDIAFVFDHVLFFIVVAMYLTNESFLWLPVQGFGISFTLNLCVSWTFLGIYLEYRNGLPLSILLQYIIFLTAHSSLIKLPSRLTHYCLLSQRAWFFWSFTTPQHLALWFCQLEWFTRVLFCLSMQCRLFLMRRDLLPSSRDHLNWSRYLYSTLY